MANDLFQEPRKRNDTAWVILALVLVVLFVKYKTGGWPFDQERRANPDVIDDDDQQVPDESWMDGAWLVVVEETKDRPVDRQVVLDDYAFWHEWIASKHMKWRRFDPDLAKAKEFIAAAEENGVRVPFVMAITSDGTVRGVLPFPRSTDAIKAWLEDL